MCYARRPALGSATRCGGDPYAGILAAILGPGHRFATDAQLAAYAGVAPLEASSAGLVGDGPQWGAAERTNGGGGLRRPVSHSPVSDALAPSRWRWKCSIAAHAET